MRATWAYGAEDRSSGVADLGADAVLVALDDERTAAGLPDLRWDLHDAVLTGASRIVVDMSGMHRLTSAALAALLGAHRRCRARGGGVTIRGGNPATLDLLHRSGLHRVFHLENSRRLNCPERTAERGAA